MHHSPRQHLLARSATVIALVSAACSSTSLPGASSAPQTASPVAQSTDGAAQGEAAEEPGWQFEVEPYVWLPNTDGTGTTDTTPPLDIDLVGTFDAALPLAFAARSPSGRYIVLADGFYLRLTDEAGILKTSTEIGMLEAGAGVAIDTAQHWHAIAGLRYVDVRYDAQVGSTEGRSDGGWLDPWIGTRAEYAFNDRWSTRLRGDVGGFGLGTELTWQAMAVLRARIIGDLSVDLGYRAIHVDYEDGGTKYDVLFHGPLAGLGISF